MSFESTLSPVQLQCIDLLVLGHSMESTARKLNISSRTIRRWKKDAEFAEELSENVNDLRDQIGCLTLATARQSTQYAGAAFNAMLPLLEDKDPSVVMRAANTITTMSLKMSKLMVVLENQNKKQAAAEKAAEEERAPKSASATSVVPAEQSTEPGQKRTSDDDVEAKSPESPANIAAEPGHFRTSAPEANVARSKNSKMIDEVVDKLIAESPLSRAVAS